MIHASGITFMQPPGYTPPWAASLSRYPVRKVEWYNPVGRFQAGRNLHSGDWYAGMPLWFPWFVAAGCGWLFLKRLERRTAAAMENKLAREQLGETP